MVSARDDSCFKSYTSKLFSLFKGHVNCLFEIVHLVHSISIGICYVYLKRKNAVSGLIYFIWFPVSEWISFNYYDNDTTRAYNEFAFIARFPF